MIFPQPAQPAFQRTLSSKTVKGALSNFHSARISLRPLALTLPTGERGKQFSNHAALVIL